MNEPTNQHRAEAQAAQTSLEDLRKNALEHYEKVTIAAHEWNSVVPRAINTYFDNQIAPTPRKEEARERAWAVCEELNNIRKVSLSNADLLWLVGRITSTLSARDAEIREVLEGLSTLRRYDHGQPERCWCDADDSETPHMPDCLAARALYTKLQPAKESTKQAVLR